MSSPRRFEITAINISKQFPNREICIADIAGGKGYLNLALKEIGYNNVISFDKRSRHVHKNKINFQYRLFNIDMAKDFDLLVGLHPDEATDLIIKAGSIYKKSFFIVPCCIMPNTVQFWDKYKFPVWIEHLKKYSIKLGYNNIQEIQLKFDGRNIALVGKIN